MQLDRERRPGELTFSILMLALAAAILYVAYGIAGFASLISAGMFPMLAGAAMVGSALVILNDTRKKSTATSPHGAPTQFFRVVSPRHFLVFAAMAAAYMLALQPLGFLLSTFIFLSASMLYLHRRGLFLTLVLSGGSLAAIYVVFRLLFAVVLPQGDIFR